MVVNHPVEWWQLGAVALVLFGGLRWYVPAAVESAVAHRFAAERERRRAEIEQERQKIALARVGRFQATAPTAEVTSGGQ
jgi:hypothetical protein